MKFLIISFFFYINFPLLSQEIVQTGLCSYYSDKFHGRFTASGEKYDKNAFTAAHRTLPFNTYVEITNLRNQKKVIVRINDRGPATKKRIIDVSKAAAIQLDMLLYGVEKVEIKIIPDSMEWIKRYTEIPDFFQIDTTVFKESKNNIFDENLQPCSPTGYGVQLGYYKILKNCTNDLIKYENEFKVQGFIMAEKKQKNTYYRLILGDYPHKKDAQNIQQKLKHKVSGCFVVHWDSL